MHHLKPVHTARKAAAPAPLHAKHRIFHAAPPLHARPMASSLPRDPLTKHLHAVGPISPT